MAVPELSAVITWVMILNHEGHEVENLEDFFVLLIVKTVFWLIKLAEDMIKASESVISYFLKGVRAALPRTTLAISAVPPAGTVTMASRNRR